MKQNKCLEEVWEWKKKSNKELEGLSIEKSVEIIKKGTSETIKRLKLRYFWLPERIQLKK